MKAGIALPGGHGSSAHGARHIALLTAALCACLLLPSAAAALLDVRTLNGVNIWAKPLKFQFSFGVHWLTIAWLLGCMAPAERERPATLWPLRIGGFAAVVEVLYITIQSARGRHSHFNFETPFETVLYFALMGGAALVMMVATAWIGWRVWRHPGRTGHTQGAGLWLGAVLGLLCGSVITLLTTAPLASGAIAGPGHWVGGLRSDATGLPLFGWSTTGGDLRVPHFFAAHLLQALPITGWLADRLNARFASTWVWAVAGLGLGAVVLTMVQAVAGQPFLGWSLQR